MSAIYFLSLLALQFIETPSEILCALHHLSAEEGQCFLFLQSHRDLCGGGTGSQNGCICFYFFTILESGFVKGFVLVVFFSPP